MSQEPVVTWVTLEKPTFDLVGVVLGSFQLAGVLLVVALAFGLAFGMLLILRRRPDAPPLDEVSLHLDTRG